MLKSEAIRRLNSHNSTSVRWIANVVMTSHKDSAKKLKALCGLLDEGYEISSQQFDMPDKGILIDGYFFNWESIILFHPRSFRMMIQQKQLSGNRPEIQES